MKRAPLTLSLLAAGFLFAACASTNLAEETSVKPGINDSWRSEDIEPLIGRLETESREIYTQRGLIGAVVGPKPGSTIADIGAGSGFMTHLFSKMVGPEGHVYAVDINQTMLDSISEGALEKGLLNVETVLCTEKSAELPPESVDIVFICDTYHHFEFPRNTMSTIHSALKPGGQLVLVDFDRIPGQSREWLLDHVRAGKDVFRAEVEAQGFEFTNEHALEPLTDNYILRFRKK
ncbi:MAG: putative methyltransferase [Planctomycetota bacterium]|jgi:predicted methyltransferase